MRYSTCLLLGATLAVAACEREPAFLSAPGELARFEKVAVPRERIPDQYIVMFRDGVTDAPGLARQLADAHGGRTLHVYRHAAKGFAARLPVAALAALRRNPHVRLVEPDVMDMTAEDTLGIVDDPEAVEASAGDWGLDRIDQRDLPLDGRYTYASTGRDVNVYVIDSGIRFTHGEFGGRAFPGVDLVGDGRNGADCNGHGTHVAGIIGGERYGVAKNARLHSVRILPCRGGSPRSRTIAAVDWVVANHVKPAVVNLSVSGRNEGYPGLSALDLVVEGAVARGITFVVAAGNDWGADACTASPAAAPSVITVGASERSDTRADFSNAGGCVDLFAPGAQIRSASHAHDEWSTGRSGTSMASPQAAGVAALFLERRPTASPREVAAAIGVNSTAGRLTALGAGSANRLLNSVSLARVDLLPGSAENPLNAANAGTIPLAILSDHDVDASRIAPASVTLGDGEGQEVRVARRPNGTLAASMEDIDQDGRADLVLHFSVASLVQNGDVVAATTRLVVGGEMQDGWPVRGSDGVRIVP